MLQTGVGRWLSASGAWVFSDREQSRVLTPRAFIHEFTSHSVSGHKYVRGSQCYAMSWCVVGIC